MIRMKAALFYEPKRPLSVEEVATPNISSQDVLVKIKTAGICRGDIQRMDGSIKVNKTPLILGHEPAGTIAEVGGEVEGFSVGENVFLFAVGCGECFYCKIGKDNLCNAIPQGFGLGRDGGYAEYVTARPRELMKLPEGVPFEAGSVMTASTGTVFHATQLAGVVPGDTAVIYGAGCLGTQAVQLLKAMGARVFLVDIVEEKLEMAKRLGADEVINAKEGDPVTRVKALTEGRGADVSFEVVGLSQTLTQAVDSVRSGGTIMDIGSIMEPFTFSMVPFVDYGMAMSKELTLKTVSHCSRKDMSKLVDLLGHTKIDFELGTERVALDDINHGFDTKRNSNKFRVVIMPEW